MFNGDELRRYEGHTNWVLGAAFSPNGDTILTGAEDNTARLWRNAPTLDDLIAWARDNRYIPVLTCPEREQYRVEPLCESVSR